MSGRPIGTTASCRCSSWTPCGVGLDPDLPAVKLEVLDSLGQGWAALLDPDEALELTLKLSGALARLQRLTVA
jgi:hypothetical protein